MENKEIFGALQFLIEVILIPILVRMFARLRELERSMAINDEQNKHMSRELQNMREEMLYLRSWFAKNNRR